VLPAGDDSTAIPPVLLTLCSMRVNLDHIDT
jgi:hypothetical protein